MEGHLPRRTLDSLPVTVFAKHRLLLARWCQYSMFATDDATLAPSNEPRPAWHIAKQLNERFSVSDLTPHIDGRAEALVDELEKAMGGTSIYHIDLALHALESRVIGQKLVPNLVDLDTFLTMEPDSSYPHVGAWKARLESLLGYNRLPIASEQLKKQVDALLLDVERLSRRIRNASMVHPVVLAHVLKDIEALQSESKTLRSELSRLYETSVEGTPREGVTPQLERDLRIWFLTKCVGKKAARYGDLYGEVGNLRSRMTNLKKVLFGEFPEERQRREFGILFFDKTPRAIFTDPKLAAGLSA